MSRGYVYVLTNESMPNLVKIGMTTRSVQQRAGELFQTGVPTPFEVCAEYECPNCAEVEAWVHSKLSECRVSQSREFFICPPNKAISVVEECHRAQVDAWLWEFLPDHCAVEVDEIVDLGAFSGSFYDAVYQSGILPIELVEMLYELDGDDVKNAILRLKEKKRRRKMRLDAGLPFGSLDLSDIASEIQEKDVRGVTK